VEAQLYQPAALAADAQGNLYIADAGNYRVRKVAPDGTISTVAGSGVRGDDGDGGPASQGRLMHPSGLAVDSHGAIYVADAEAHRVRRVSSDGTIATIAGTGLRGFSGDGGPATAAQLNRPVRVAVDAAGRVYIADEQNYRIRRVEPDGTIRTVAGKGRVDRFFNEHRGDGGPATEAAFQSVLDLALDPAGVLYVSDPYDGRIRRIGADGLIQTVVGPVNGRSIPDDGVPALAVDTYIASFSVDSNGTIYFTSPPYFGAMTLWRVGPEQVLDRVPSDVNLLGPVHVSPSGKIYQITWSDSVWTISDGKAALFAGGNTAGYSGDGGPATSAAMWFPFGLAFDAGGNLLIADHFNSRVRKVSADGIIDSIAGSGVQPYPHTAIGDGGPATAAALYAPRWLAADHDGNLYIGDGYGHRIRKVDRDGIISTFAGNGDFGITGNLPSMTEPFPATSMPIDINGLAVDSSGTVYLSDASRKYSAGHGISSGIYRITPDGMMSWFIPLLSSYPDGSELGQLFINGSDQVFALRPGGTSVERISSDGLSVESIARSGDYAALPRAFTFDAGGNLYLVGLKSPIRKISPDGVVTTVFGGPGRNATSVDGPAFQHAPTGVSAMIADAEGNLYFSDHWRSRIRMIPNASTCEGAVYPLAANRGIVNAASYNGSPIAPGEIVTIFGVNLGPETPEYARLGPDGRLTTDLGGVRVLVDGIPAPLIYVSAGQVSAIVPYEVAGRGDADIAVEFHGFPGESSTYLVENAHAGIFTLDASGKGQAAALNADNSVNGPENPVARGSVIVLYATGEGQTDPPGVNGAIAGGVLPQPVLPVRVQIAGQEAVVEYAGAAPGFAAGLMQVNARVPESVSPGPAVPVVLQVGDRPSPPGVTIGVK
jgi:uncharacterized protein (TIGR03437 family)